jgi:hypothetical protein
MIKTDRWVGIGLERGDAYGGRALRQRFSIEIRETLIQETAWADFFAVMDFQSYSSLYSPST